MADPLPNREVFNQRVEEAQGPGGRNKPGDDPSCHPGEIQYLRLHSLGICSLSLGKNSLLCN